MAAVVALPRYYLSLFSLRCPVDLGISGRGEARANEIDAPSIIDVSSRIVVYVYIYIYIYMRLAQVYSASCVLVLFKSLDSAPP